MSESLAQRLSLPRKATSISVVGVGGNRTGIARGQLNVVVSSREGRSPMTVSALILPQLTIYDGCYQAERRPWRHLAGLQLADPDFLATDPVDLLLGADVLSAILLPGLRRGGPLDPVAQRTVWGWMLSGSVGTKADRPTWANAHACQEDHQLTGLVQQFWK